MFQKQFNKDSVGMATILVTRVDRSYFQKTSVTDLTDEFQNKSPGFSYMFGLVTTKIDF